MSSRNVLISGAGIAGLTLAIRLKQRGLDPLVVEREPALPSEGYMMDFFGTGWDVAERMGLTDEIRAVRYPIDRLEFVDADGQATLAVPIERMRRALHDRYNYLRRTDLARILHRRAEALGIPTRFGATVERLERRGSDVRATLTDGDQRDATLVFGADGIHSRVRELTFGPEQPFDRYLGYYVAAFHIDGHRYDIGRAVKLYEEPDRLLMIYPLDESRLDATYIFRHPDVGFVAPDRRLDFIRKAFTGAGWLAERLLTDHPASQPLYFDPTMQIVMPQWHRDRVALVGDACGALTLLAGQGSHMAMAGGYLLAEELARASGDHRAAFAGYEARLRPLVEKKQRDASWLAGLFVPKHNSWPWLRRLVIRAILSAPLAPYTMSYAGATSALPKAA